MYFDGFLRKTIKTTVFCYIFTGAPQVMGIIWDFLMILKSASRSGQQASKTIGYSDGCANV